MRSRGGECAGVLSALTPGLTADRVVARVRHAVVQPGQNHPEWFPGDHVIARAAPSSYKSKLGHQRGLDLAWKLEIPILSLILILPDGIVRSRGTTMHPETLPGTREVARGDRETARHPVSHFLSSSCDPFASNAILSLSYVFLDH
ncbi:hypothetical protein PIB30_087092 [Stylosanthes scabra]|uniref:Uncharacterized protein n=1 Tax=Stylosanthes scabra TaxID=79078 RepID=A0ABU6WT48_9FABA|nr:hypothetical protein [Stylosanthes scabra]